MELYLISCQFDSIQSFNMQNSALFEVYKRMTYAHKRKMWGTSISILKSGWIQNMRLNAFYHDHFLIIYSIIVWFFRLCIPQIAHILLMYIVRMSITMVFGHQWWAFDINTFALFMHNMNIKENQIINECIIHIEM